MSSLIRIAAAGSVDDGKSTLIGRILLDTGSVPRDYIAAIRSRSGELDLAALSDGLSAEQEQGITIDVAYRYFTFNQCSYILADTPGHEQYTRNMFTGVSTATIVMIVVDATKGLSLQTYRHLSIAHLLRIPRIIVAINKMDLVHYAQATYDAITEELHRNAHTAGWNITTIPITALTGDNIVTPTTTMPWYTGSPLLTELSSTPLDHHASTDLVIPIQSVMRPTGDTQRIYTGTIASGILHPQDTVIVYPSGRTSTIAEINPAHPQSPPDAHAGQAVSITLTNNYDIGRGAVLTNAHAATTIHVANQVSAVICWFDDHPLQVSHRYLITLATQETTALISSIESVYDLASLSHTHTCDRVEINDIATITCTFFTPLTISTYADHPILGSFIIIDRDSYNTVGAGIITHITPEATNTPPETIDTSWESRTPPGQHQKSIIIAGAVEYETISNHLHSIHTPHYLVDDTLLERQFPTAHFSRHEREEAIALISLVLADAGITPIIPASSPSLITHANRAGITLTPWDPLTPQNP